MNLKSREWKFALLCLLVAGAALVTPSIAMQGDTIADRVLGQADFVHNFGNSPDGRKLNNPIAVAIDKSTTPNRLYVADFQNSRVLGWNDVTAFSNGAPADLVLGQADFLSAACNRNGGSASASSLCGPSSVAVDAAGNLYVADDFNSRVLEYNSPLAACGSFPCVGGAANKVFGQAGSLTANNNCFNSGVTANSLCFPTGLAVDGSGDLYVADSTNNRVLEYNSPLSNTTADTVFGQGGSFSSNGCVAATANSLCNPTGVALDTSANLYVADNSNNRVLEYDTPLSTDTTADEVFGQSGSFTSSACNNGGTTANSLCNPFGVAVDASANLYIADQNNNRVLEYNTPLTTDTTADTVFGQGGAFTSNACDNGGASASADNLCGPSAAALDAGGNLYVADESNNRVLQYDSPLLTDTTADRELGQLDFVHDAPNFPDQRSLFVPIAAAVDRSATPNRLYIADQNNSRVLGYKDVATFVNGGAADLVIGQPDFLSGACDDGGVSASSLCFPQGVATDASGNLYVADQSNNRVLEYNSPFAGCGSTPCVGGPANLVFGQGGDFSSESCNEGGASASADSLCGPSGVALDAGDNLYIADSSNHRVLEYNTPFSTDTTADMVFGQSGSFSSNLCNHGGANATADSLCNPTGVAVDPGANLYVADDSNSRVLEYNAPLIHGTTADMVFGQGGSFTSDNCNNGGANATANSLCDPFGVAVDFDADLYVADQNNNRVLEYKTPLTTDTTPDVVFGQGGSFNSEGCNLGGVSASASSLCGPSGVALDSSANLYVADQSNNRVLKYDNPVSLATPTATATATATATRTPTATPTATPTPLAGVPASFALGSEPVGDTVTKNMTVTNNGQAPLVISSATPSDSEYVLSGTGTCGAIPVTVTPLTSCTLAIAFTPNALGAHPATMTVIDNAATSPKHVALSGTGTVDMTVAPTSYGFGSVKDGSKAVKVIVVHNYQTNSVSLNEGFSGPNAGDFSITGGTCTSMLAKTSICTLIVTYAPTATGTESATMTVTDSPDPLGPYTVSFSSSPAIPESLSATKLVFGNVYQTASKALSITVTNKGTSGPITLTGTSISGANSGDFAVTGGTCTGTLASSSSCTYAVTFTPSTETPESGTLSIGVAEDPNGGPPAVALSGTGVTPLKALPATGIAFGIVAGGHSSLNKTVTVYNYGGATVSLSESITGTNEGDFAVTGQTCGSTLVGGISHCTYTLKFTPSIVGDESATFGVSAAGDAASPHNLPLTGTGS